MPSPQAPVQPRHAWAPRLAGRGSAGLVALAAAVLIAGCGSTARTTSTSGAISEHAAGPPEMTGGQASQPASAGTQAQAPTATTGTGAAGKPKQPTGQPARVFAACISRHGWRIAPNPAIDHAARLLRASPGFHAMVLVTAGHGRRVAAAFYETTEQAEKAEINAGLQVEGRGHASYSTKAATAWINYAGTTAVDRLVAGCAPHP